MKKDIIEFVERIVHFCLLNDDNMSQRPRQTLYKKAMNNLRLSSEYNAFLFRH